MIHIDRKEDCVGCGACLDICPKNAVSWDTDIEGFWYPTVNLELCIDCGLCDRSCPVINADELNKTNTQSPKVLASYNTDEEVRFKSTSGGVFSALAEQMYSRKGFVAGAIFTEEFGAKHVISNNRNDLFRIRGSKYFQSDCTGIYNSIKEKLKQDEQVLVCGCPCQMAGLRSFLNKEYSNLIIVDFICCSINSPKAFRKYLDDLESQYGAKVVNYHPKNKEYGGWHNFSFKATFTNGKVYHRERTTDLFTLGFIGSHILARPSCYECRFKKIPRVADITIADFWGIETIDSSMDSPHGTSAVLLNNKKGIDYFESLEDTVYSLEKTFDDVLRGNSNLLHSISRPTFSRNSFYKDLETMPFSKCMKKYSKKNIISSIFHLAKRIKRKLF